MPRRGGLMRAAIGLVALFAIGAVGAMLFVRMRGSPDAAIESPLAPMRQTSPPSAPANALVANSMPAQPPLSGAAPAQIPMLAASALPT
ncbi:MAG: hypothetical protein WA571_11160, partial [Candidatus Binatus sp.]